MYRFLDLCKNYLSNSPSISDFELCMCTVLGALPITLVVCVEESFCIYLFCGFLHYCCTFLLRPSEPFFVHPQSMFCAYSAAGNIGPWILNTKGNTRSRVFDVGSLLLFRLFAVTQERICKIFTK